MASWVLQHYHASTKATAEAALKQGILKYPAICYIREGSYTAWVTKDGILDFVGGYNQITNIDYQDGLLCFMSGNEVLYTADVAITPDTENRIKNEIISNLRLDAYAKSEDVIKLVGQTVGDFGSYNNVVDYINNLSYNRLKDTPIINVYGTLTKTIVLSGLADGVYRVAGQFQVGGDHKTIQLSTDDAVFIIARDNNDHSIHITQILGSMIKLYHLDADGAYVTDHYITENYLKDKDFITSSEVKTYVKSLVTDAIVETIDAVLDDRLNEKLNQKLGDIPDESILGLFREEI